MYFRRKTADYFRSNFSSIQTLILRFGYLWADQAGLAKGHRTPETPEHTTWSTQGSTVLSRHAILFLSSLRNDGCH